jgi:putative transcriptional regulator
MVKGDQAMDKRLFADLKKSVMEMDAIIHGERAPSREFVVDALAVKQIRSATGLSQAKFARLIDVQVTTLRNWEQGRREPTGPAKALLRAIQNDPRHVLQALAGEQSPATDRRRVRRELRA